MRIFFTTLSISLLLWGCSKHKTAETSRQTKTESPSNSPVGKDADLLADEETRPAAAAAFGGSRGLAESDGKERGGQVSLGRIFTPGINAIGSERKLEYAIQVNYQIDSIKAARAFFNQWIPRFGFLSQESASGHGTPYMNLTVRVRSQNLYAALAELDGMGSLLSENITVRDHTENLVHQQMLGAREDIRNRRRSLAAQSTTPQAKNWEATENLLSTSEDKQLATRMEEWRVGDRTQWATIQIALSLPASATIVPIEVPEYKNAFVGLLNVFLQMLYAAIYLIPLAIVAFLVYRSIRKYAPRMHAWARR